jgi:hypothetical protein
MTDFGPGAKSRFKANISSFKQALGGNDSEQLIHSHSLLVKNIHCALTHLCVGKSSISSRIPAGRKLIAVPILNSTNDYDHNKLRKLFLSFKKAADRINQLLRLRKMINFGLIVHARNSKTHR